MYYSVLHYYSRTHFDRPLLKKYTQTFDGRCGLFSIVFRRPTDFYRTISLKGSEIKKLGFSYMCIFSEGAYRYEFDCNSK
ncbi:hypothetical protein L208DRAFT_466431 [Tricholoma matsutake]|nr:hypothetical protein L208DRAFT_466431 [Tricholoma matsutake 945]